MMFESSLDSKMECLQLTMTEVLKRQSGKGKKGFNQVSVFLCVSLLVEV